MLNVMDMESEVVRLFMDDKRMPSPYEGFSSYNNQDQPNCYRLLFQTILHNWTEVFVICIFEDFFVIFTSFCGHFMYTEIL